jgi:hypothetical protein
MVALDGMMIPAFSYNYETGKIRITIGVTNPSNLDVFTTASSALEAAGMPFGSTSNPLTIPAGTQVYFGTVPVFISFSGEGGGGPVYATYEVSRLFRSIADSTQLQYTDNTELFIRNVEEVYFTL